MQCFTRSLLRNRVAAAFIAASNPEGHNQYTQNGGEPLRYDPNTDKHNGKKLVRGDILVGENGKNYSLDRNSGYTLQADELDKNMKTTNKSVAFSVDPTDKDRFFNVKHTGQNRFEFESNGSGQKKLL